MIPHICGKEDPWCHFSNLHTSNLSKIFTIPLPGAVLSSCGGTLLNSSTIPVSHSSTLDPGRWSYTQDNTFWDVRNTQDSPAVTLADDDGQAMKNLLHG